MTTIQKMIRGCDGGEEDRFGIDLSVKGVWAAISAIGVSSYSGAVYMYNHDGNHWVFMQSLIASDGAGYDYFGHGVALSGTGHLVVGAHGNDDKGSLSGAVYLYTLNSTSNTWGDEQKIFASDGAEGVYFGFAVAMSGTGHLVVGAPYDDDMGSYSGAVYLYTLNSSSNTWGDEQKIVASDGAAYDNFGRAVAMSGTGHLVVGAPYDDDKGSLSGAVYLYTLNSTSNTWGDEQKIFASDGIADDWFGWSIALSGTGHLVVGAFGDGTNGFYSGAVYLYTLNSTSNTWGDEQKIVASDGAEMDWFGESVAMSGAGHLVVGARWNSGVGVNSGSVYLYTLNSTSNTWGDEQKIVASDGAALEWFGESVAMSENVHLLVGAPYDDDMGFSSGSVYAIGEGAPTSFPTTSDPTVSPSTKSPSQAPTMTTIQKMICGCDGGEEDRFGIDLSVKGVWAAISAIGVSSYSGAVYMYNHDGNHWVFMQSLIASDGAGYDYFGHGVALSGTGHLVVGAHGNDDKGSLSGAVYLYTLNSTSNTWGDEQKIFASDGAEGVYFGFAVAMSGTGHLVVGAPYDDDMGSYSGAVYLYTLNSSSNTWGDEQKIVASDGAAYDNFGRAVAMSGTGHLVVGAPYDDDKGSLSGAVYLYTLNSTSNTWGDEQKIFASDGIADDWFGWSIALSGTGHLVVGAFGDGTNGFYSGAVYLYTLNSTSNTWGDEQKIVASDGAEMDWFGESVAMSGAGHLVVGARWNSGVGVNSGSVYLYTLNSTSNTWGDEQKIVASDGAALEWFGESVAMSENVHLLVGAPYDDDMGFSSGSVYAIGEGAPTSSPTTSDPTVSPSTESPSQAPTASPITPDPTKSPSTESPSQAPTASPITPDPTKAPTSSPTTSDPTVSPSTKSPSQAPTASPITPDPTKSPSTKSPSQAPTASPITPDPTKSPSTESPSQAPTASPITPDPTKSPSTESPSQAPTASPITPDPTKSPSTESPSQAPTASPITPDPTKAPTSSPTTSDPTVNSSPSPSSLPTKVISTVTVTIPGVFSFNNTAALSTLNSTQVSELAESLGSTIESIACENVTNSETSCDVIVTSINGETFFQRRLLFSRRLEALFVEYDVIVKLLCNTDCSDTQSIAANITSEIQGTMETSFIDGSLLSTLKSDTADSVVLAYLVTAKPDLITFGEVVTVVTTATPSKAPTASPTNPPSKVPMASPTRRPVNTKAKKKKGKTRKF
eukprot:g4767.t1 g4767   contig16:284222-295160(-)